MNFNTSYYRRIQKMNLRRKLSIFTMLFVMAMVFMVPINAKAATIGDRLPEPESSWQRFDDTDTRIVYNGSWQNSTTMSSFYYNNKNSYTASQGSSYRFKFYGTKLRLLVGTNTYGHCTQVSVKIDGNEYYFNETTTSYTGCYLIFEKIGLVEGYHTVVVTNTQDTKYMSLDAFDIDETGYLVDYYQPIYLTTESGDSQVTLAWGTVDDATSYNIKRSETSGGPYEVLSLATTVSGSSIICTDTGLTNGTTYYYVVSAVVSGTEIVNSNEAFAIPVAPTVTSSAILNIYMDNGIVKEYNLTGTEIDNFLSWYNDISNGAGKAFYIFTVKGTVTPYKSIKHYIPYNKIIYFDVKSYEE
jgi:hypothetical protein